MAPVESLSQALYDAAHETEPDVATAVHRGLERGRRMRRSRRIAQVAGATAAVVAVGTVGAFAFGGTHHQHTVSPPPPASSTTPKPTTHKTPPTNPYTHSSDKVLDIRMHMPTLLQQLLPSGTTVGDAPKDWATVAITGATFVVSNATGTSQVDVQAMSKDEAAAVTMFGYCEQSHNATKPCQTRKVPGGTIYVADQDRTALDDSAGQAPAGRFQPGHERDVIWRSEKLTFVPDDSSGYYIRLDETTQVEAIPLANTPTAGSAAYRWPPTDGSVKGPTGTGLAISPDDFAAMIGKPQMSQIAQLYDNDVPASHSAIAERDRINAQVADLVGPALPPGVKIAVNYSEDWHAFLTLTGPTGVNGLLWYTDTHSHALQATNNLKCQPDDRGCEVKKVPGGTVQWANRFDMSQQADFEYVPDDPNGTAVAIDLFPTDSVSGQMNVIPGRKSSPVQLTYDQLLALATSANIADIVRQANALGR